MSILKSLVVYTSDTCALKWRISLVDALQKKFVKDDVAYHVLSNDLIENVDQRITQDVDRFTTLFSQLLVKVIVLPLVILYYWYFLTVRFGAYVPLVCFMYFAVGGFVSYFLARKLPSLVYSQEQREGNFRFQHVWYKLHTTESIAIQQGSDRELEYLENKFNEIVTNQYAIINTKFPLGVATNWFDYTASIVSYSVIGLSILSGPKVDDASEGDGGTGDRAGQMTLGVYAAMYLISAFSVLLDSVDICTNIHGLVRRIHECLVVCNCVAPVDTSAANKTQSWINSDGGLWKWLLRVWYVKRGTSGLYDELLQDSDQEHSDQDDCEAQSTIELVGNVESIETDATLVCGQYDGFRSKTAEFGEKGESDIVIECVGICVLRPTSMSPHLHISSNVLLANLQLTVLTGMRLLISGPSGCGKSSMLKMFAGLDSYHVCCCSPDQPMQPNYSYSLLPLSQGGHMDIKTTDPNLNPKATDQPLATPATEGYVHINANRSALYFTSQAPYCFKGSLRDNIIYPQSRSTISSLRLCELLNQLSLSYLLHYNDGDMNNMVSTKEDIGLVCADWPRVLSKGEQQRLAWIRLLYHQPAVIIIDEGTSAVEEEMEKQMYSLLPPDATILSIGHRPSLTPFHTHRLNIYPHTHTISAVTYED